jgi:hypothetical protein
LSRLRDRGHADRAEQALSEAQVLLSINTELGREFPDALGGQDGIEIVIEPLAGGAGWRVSRKDSRGPKSELEVTAPYNYNSRGDRARKFITEKALHLLTTAF